MNIDWVLGLVCCLIGSALLPDIQTTVAVCLIGMGAALMARQS